MPDAKEYSWHSQEEIKITYLKTWVENLSIRDTGREKGKILLFSYLRITKQNLLKLLKISSEMAFWELMATSGVTQSNGEIRHSNPYFGLTKTKFVLFHKVFQHS